MDSMGFLKECGPELRNQPPFVGVELWLPPHTDLILTASSHLPGPNLGFFHQPDLAFKADFPTQTRNSDFSP